MGKSQAPIILLVFVMFAAMIALSGCVGDDSNNSTINSNGSPVDRSASRNGNGSNDSAAYIWDFNETQGPLTPIELVPVPIDDAYSREILGDINVSDATLESYTRFGLRLEEQGVDAEAENISILFIDDDLRVIENYWVFATRPESKERRMERIQNSNSTNPSSDEMVAFLKQFDEKYPVKYVRTGVVLFVTIENKDTLISEISDEDRRMLEAIARVLVTPNDANSSDGNSSDGN